MIAAAITVVLAGQFGGSALDNALVDGDKVHLFLPPVVVSEGRVENSAWSNDGRYLMTVTASAPIGPQEVKKVYDGHPPTLPRQALSLNIFNALTGTVKTLWRDDSEGPASVYIEFFENSDVALVLVQLANESLLLRVTGGTSRVETIERFDEKLAGSLGLEANPKGRYIASQTFDPSTVRFITASGPVAPRRILEDGSYGMWTMRGDYVLHFTDDSHKVIDPVSGSISIREGKPNLGYRMEEEGLVKFDESSMEIPGRKKELSIVIASAGGKQLSVAFDAELHKACDRGVFFAVDAVNMVRPVIQIPRVAFEELVAREQRAEVIANLNQIGKALTMYAADNDDTFPTKDELENRAIDGYLGDPSLLKGFVYHGKTSYGNDLALTEAGYMLCPGGRAVLYQDGHVFFEPNR